MTDNVVQIVLAAIAIIASAGGGIMYIFKLLDKIINSGNTSREESDKRHSALVDKVMKDSNSREEKLFIELDKYNESLVRIADAIADIPSMKNDIADIKAKVHTH